MLRTGASILKRKQSPFQRPVHQRAFTLIVPQSIIAPLPLGCRVCNVPTVAGNLCWPTQRPCMTRSQHTTQRRCPY